MKRLFRKENRIARVIALLLVAIMVLTPLYQHSGLKKPTKAAPNGEAQFTLSVNVDDFVTKDETGNSVIVTGEADAAVASVKGDNTVHNMNYWNCGYSKVNIIGAVNGNLVYGDNALVDYEVVAKVYTSGTPAQTLDDLTDTVDASVPTPVDNDNVYAIYVKVKEFSYDADATTVIDTNNKYHLLAAYKLVADYTGPSAKWVNGNGKDVSGVVSSATLLEQGAVSAGDVYLGAFGYSYSKKIADKNDIADYTGDYQPVALNPGTLVQSIEGGTGSEESKGDGEYIGFVTYSDDLGSGSSKSTTIKFDNTAPVMKDGAPVTLKSYYPDEYVDISGFTYLDVSEGKNYKLEFQIKEVNPASLKINFYKENTEDLVYSQTINRWNTNVEFATYTLHNVFPGADKLPLMEAYDVKVALVDSVGNSGEEVKLMTIYPINKELSVYGITYYEVNGDGTEAEITSLSANTNKKQRVRFTVSSGNKLGYVKVSGIVQGYKEYEVILDDQELTDVTMGNGLYSKEVTLDIPKDTSHSYVLKDIKITAAEDGFNNPKTRTENLLNGEYKFDGIAPTIELIGLFVKPKNSDWQLIDSNACQNGVYVFKYEDELDYRFVVKVSDDIGRDRVEAYNNPDYAAAGLLGELTYDSSRSNESNHYYYKQYSRDDVKTYMESNGNELKLYLMAYDEAGNTGKLPVTPWLVMRDDTLLIEDTTLVDENDKIVSIDSNTSICKAHDVKIVASSGEPITEVELGYKLNGENKHITQPVALEDNKYNENNKRYTATVKISLPEDTEIDNSMLTNMRVTVFDTRKADEIKAERNLWDLLYDSTKPNITFTNADGTEFVEDLAWIKAKEFVVNAVITPGVGALESAIVSADYEITNSVNNSNGTGELDYAYETGKNDGAYIQVTMPESTNASGTNVKFTAKDKAGNSLETGSDPVIEGRTISKRIDGTEPEVRTLKINGEENKALIGKKLNVTATVADKLSIGEVYIRVENIDTKKVYKPANDYIYGTNDALNENSTEVTRDVAYSVELPDGTYKVTVKVVDKAGWEAVKDCVIVVDGTAPVVTADITQGTKGVTDYYYRSNVTVSFTCEEEHAADIRVIDTVGDKETVIPNDKLNWTVNPETGLREGHYDFTGEGTHTVKIEATDGAGNPATPDVVTFVRDTKKPTVSVYMDGVAYSGNTDPIRANRRNTDVKFQESEEIQAFYYKLTKTVPGESPIVGKYNTTNYKEFTYSEEATYKVQVYVVDMAGNVGEVTTVDFRIDKTAPNLSIGGIADGGTSSTGLIVNLNVYELYYENTTINATVSFKSPESANEEVIDEISRNGEAINTSIPVTATASGVYNIVLTANDGLNGEVTTTCTFTIDTEAPIVTLQGVSNFDVTDQDVTIASTITENFYNTKRITVTGTTTDDAGKVTPIVIDDYSAAANPTIINKTFSADGIYDLTITCVDVVGNSDSKSVHFTIDKGAPVIGDLSDIDGKTLTSFSWDKDLDELVSDLTVCDVHMYLNGQEYYGDEELEDGSYVLLITAEDELGHKTEKEVKFTLDTKKPVFIVTGVEKDEKKLEPYSITVSLQLDEDKLTSVTLNGEVVTITNNQATINITEVGEYKLCMEAVDEAGNVSSDEYEFKLISEAEQNFWIILAILATVAVLIIIILLARRRKKNN